MVNQAKLIEFLSLSVETPKREFKLRYMLSGQGRGKYLDELSKDLIALANTAGRSADDYAHLIIGAGDELKPDGTRDVEDVRPYGYNRQFLLDTVNVRCHPPIMDLYYSEIDVGGNHYGVIEIPPSPFMHELSRDLDTPRGTWRKGSVLVRHGDVVAVASFQEMLLMKQEKEAWAQPAHSSLEQLKEYLPDPAKRLKVRSLVIDEARKLHEVLNAPEFLQGDQDRRRAAIVERIREYEELTAAFLQVFTLGCHGGGEWLQSLWPEALTIIANPADRPSGTDSLLRLRRYPALLLLYAGGTACVAGSNYVNLTALLWQTRVRSYGPNDAASFGLAPGRVVDTYDEKELAESGHHRMPFNAHIASFLRKPLDSFIHSNDQFMECFVRFEYLYALVSMSQANGLIAGSFAWESEQMKGLRKYPQTRVWIVRDTEAELDQMGSDWPPLKSGLFSGPVEHFRTVKRELDQKIYEVASNFFLRN